MREVTERDLRMPEFRDAKPEELEFREDGKLVRKDRWEVALRNVVSAIGWTRREFEVHEVAAEVHRIKEMADASVTVKTLKGLKVEALEVFDGPECPQEVRDAIEWFASSIDMALEASANDDPHPAVRSADHLEGWEMNDIELNRRELTGNDALRFARESGMLRMVGSPDFRAGVGDLIRFARLVREGWTPPLPKEPAP